MPAVPEHEAMEALEVLAKLTVGDVTTHCIDKSSRSEVREVAAPSPIRPHLNCSVLRGTGSETLK